MHIKLLVVSLHHNYINNMPKLTTERIVMDGAIKNEIDFKYSISVSKEGLFSTMLPKEISEMFANANVDMAKNRLYNKGYISGSTISEVNQAVKEICKEYLSRELISETIVLKYGIETRAAYCLGSDGEIYPNGRFKAALIYDTEYKGSSYANWKNGTVSIHASSPNNYGMLVYVHPLTRLVYKYRSGKTKTEYANVNYDDDTDYVLHWLANLTVIAPGGLPIKEIEYTPNIGMVFINMIKSICLLNERIKDFIEPDAIRIIANSEIKKLL